MIRFQCSCETWLEVEDQWAGESVQCPSCGKLRSIPNEDELDTIEEDGTFRLGEVAAAPSVFDTPMPPTLRYADKNTPALPNFVSDGVIPSSGGKPGEANFAGQFAGGSVTGRAKAASMGLGTARSLRGDVIVEEPVDLKALPIQLFSWASVTVLAALLGVHFVAHVFAAFALGGPFFLVPLAGLVVLLTMAHVGLTVQETGPDGHNELPTPLGNVDPIEDFIQPLWRVLLASALCLGPAIILWKLLPTSLWLVPAIAAGIGYVFIPAALLTIVASGSIENLAPHRVLGVAMASGFSYLLVVLIVLPLGLLGYVGGIALIVESILHYHRSTLLSLNWSMLVMIPAGYTMLMVGLYLLSLAAAMTGCFYRRDYKKFPWVFQRHESTRQDPLKMAENRKKEQIAKARAQRAAERESKRETSAPVNQVVSPKP